MNYPDQDKTLNVLALKVLHARSVESEAKTARVKLEDELVEMLSNIYPTEDREALTKAEADDVMIKLKRDLSYSCNTDEVTCVIERFMIEDDYDSARLLESIFPVKRGVSKHELRSALARLDTGEREAIERLVTTKPARPKLTIEQS